jgi:transposase
LAPLDQRIKAALSQAEILHQDETGLYVAGKRDWMHDGWGSYWQFPCQHALCNVHQLRELTELSEEQQHAWVSEMKELLLDIKAAVEQARAEGRTSLHPLVVADWKTRYGSLLAEGYQANPPDPPPATSKKGRRKQSAARNLLDRLSEHQQAALLFLDNFAVPLDNGLAERDILMVKVQQKASGCFRSPAGAQAFCRIRGYLSRLCALSITSAEVSRSRSIRCIRSELSHLPNVSWRILSW